MGLVLLHDPLACAVSMPGTMSSGSTVRHEKEDGIAVFTKQARNIGSGRSTVGQFLTPIYRVALLNQRAPHLLKLQTRQTLNREGLPRPATPRYPRGFS